MRHSPLSLLLFLGLVGCQGSFVAPLEANTPLAASPNRVFACENKAASGTARTGMRRLLRRELELTLESLLGAAVYGDSSIKESAEGLPVDAMESAGDLSEATPSNWASTLFKIGKRASTLGLASAPWRTERLGACTNTKPLTEPCVESAVRTFGAKVFRRDLSTEEVASSLALYRTAGAQEAGLAVVVRSLLQAPQLAFHLEQGVSEQGGRTRLSDFEVASRLSYAVTDNMPDAALLDAARSGRLTTVEDAKREAERLIASAQGRAKVRDFLRYYTHLTRVEDPHVGTGKLHGIEVVGLGQAAKEEAFSFAETLFFNGGTFSDLMTAKQTFTQHAGLTQILGAVAQGENLLTPKHPGLLHRPGLLFSVFARTSPIIRGAHVRKLFLCDELGMPDAMAVAEREAEVGNLDHVNNRERVQQLTNSPSCLGCHVQINPLGQSFENYDSIGRARDEELVTDAAGAITARFSIDASVTNPNLDTEGPTALANSVALVEALAQSKKANACFTLRAFEYTQLRKTQSTDGCALRGAENVVHEGSLMDAFIATIANDELFYREAVEQ